MPPAAAPKTLRRRRPDDVRAEALSVARRLLMADGPQAITLKAIGAAMGMSHANLIHHFGSAEGLQARLRAELLAEIADTVRTLLEAHARGEPASVSVVDQVFHAYAQGGLGVLTAWSALSRGGGGVDHGELNRTVDQVASVVEGLIAGPDAGGRAREVLRLVMLLAFAESVIGPSLPRARSGEAGDPRAFTRRLLQLLAQDGACAKPAPPARAAND